MASKTQLSLDCLTLTDTSPLDLIPAAAAAGFDLVSLWLNSPSAFPRQLLPAAMERDCAAALSDYGIGVHTIEAFDLASKIAVRNYRPALELGARLGAQAVLAYHGSNPDRAEVLDLLGLFTDQARDCGLGVVLEPVAMGQTRTLAEGRQLIGDAGVDARLLFDTWHFMRAGGWPGDLSALDAELIGYVQINDGVRHIPFEDMIPEAMCERLYPGDGEFPLAELLHFAPKDVPWGIETPSVRRSKLGFSADDQAREAMSAMERLLKLI